MPKLKLTGVVGWCDGAGRPTYSDKSRARAYSLAVGVGGGCLDIFFSHLSFLFSFSLSLGDKAS